MPTFLFIFFDPPRTSAHTCLWWSGARVRPTRTHTHTAGRPTYPPSDVSAKNKTPGQTNQANHKRGCWVFLGKFWILGETPMLAKEWRLLVIKK